VHYDEALSFEDAPRREQVVGLLWLVWRLSQNLKRPAEQVDGYMRWVCKPDLFKPGEPAPGRKMPGMGWSANRDVLWIKPSSQEFFSDLKRAGYKGLPKSRLESFWHEKHDVYKHVMGAQLDGRLARWQRDGCVVLPECFEEDEFGAATLAVILGFGAGLPYSVPFGGALLVGFEVEAEPGVVWIGVRRDLELLQRSPKERMRSLWHPEDFIRKIRVVEPVASEGPDSVWWDVAHADVAARGVTPSQLQSFVDGAWSNWATKAREDCAEEHALLSPAVVHIADATRCEETFREYVERNEEVLAVRQDARLLPVVTNVPERVAADVLCSALGPRSVGQLRVGFVGQEAVGDFCFRQPWLWSKWFGRERGFDVVRGDLGFCRWLLVPQVVDARMIPLLGGVVHPRVAEVAGGDWSGLCLVGRSGMGKSAGLYHLLGDSGAERLVVVVDAHRSSQDWSLAVSIVESALTNCGSEVVFVLDDAHLGAPGFVALRELYSLFGRWRKEKRKTVARVLLSFRTPDTSASKESLSSVLSDYGLTEVLLDGAPREYFSSLAGLWASVGDGGLKGVGVEELVGRAVVEGLGVREFLQCLTSRRFDAGYESLFGGLLAFGLPWRRGWGRREQRQDLNVLRALTGTFSPVDGFRPEHLQRALSSLFGSVDEFWRCVYRVEQAGAVRFERGRVVRTAWAVDVLFRMAAAAPDVAFAAERFRR